MEEGFRGMQLKQKVSVVFAQRFEPGTNLVPTYFKITDALVTLVTLWLIIHSYPNQFPTKIDDLYQDSSYCFVIMTIVGREDKRR